MIKTKKRNSVISEGWLGFLLFLFAPPSVLAVSASIPFWQALLWVWGAYTLFGLFGYAMYCTKKAATNGRSGW